MQTQLKVKMNKMNPTLDRNVVGLNDGDMDGDMDGLVYGLVYGLVDGLEMGLAEWISLGDSVSVADGVRLGVWLRVGQLS